MCKENGSSFLDIGSGFGKPVFHAAMQTACPSYGVEIVPVRVEVSANLKYGFEEAYQKAVRRGGKKGGNKGKGLLHLTLKKRPSMQPSHNYEELSVKEQLAELRKM